MKKNRFNIVLLLAFFLVSPSFSKDKVSATVGVTPVSVSEDNTVSFGGTYGLFDVLLSNDYASIGGKLYYRIGSSDSLDSLSQKLEVKKAYIKVRPFGKDTLEVALGKLYSYYLPGSYFPLSEIYTGSSRWGKTGLGFSLSSFGIRGGLALPLLESYKSFSSEFGIHGGLSYDIKNALPSIPLTVGGTIFYDYAEEKTVWAGTLALYWTPSFDGIISKLSCFLGFSFNSEPLVSSSVYKNISNYKKIGNAHFASVNLYSAIGDFLVYLEGEGGVSLEEPYIPLYTGLQVHIPLISHIALRPRFFYYAGLDYKNSSLSRSSFELYPRLWFSFESLSLSVSAGADFLFRETDKNVYDLSWNIPIYVQYSF